MESIRHHLDIKMPHILAHRELSVSWTPNSDDFAAAVSHFCQQENGAKRSDVNNYYPATVLQQWFLLSLCCQDVKKSQFPVLIAINFISHRNVESNWILQQRLVSFLCISLLHFHVRQDMNCEHFTQVPFDPGLMRLFYTSLRFLFHLLSLVWIFSLPWHCFLLKQHLAFCEHQGAKNICSAASLEAIYDESGAYRLSFSTEMFT